MYYPQKVCNWRRLGGGNGQNSEEEGMCFNKNIVDIHPKVNARSRYLDEKAVPK